MIARRTFLQVMGAGFAGGLAGYTLPRRYSWADELKSAGTTKPNILIIVTDDQGYADLSAFSHHAPDIRTPNMDRISQDGILFSQAYVTAPVCSPSRAGWNTGCYQQRWGHWRWGAKLPPGLKTLAEYLKGAGYVTGKVGKSDFGVGYHSHDSREYPLNHGFDEFLGFSSHAHDYFLLSEEIEKRTPDPHGHSAALGPLMHNRVWKEYKEGYTTEIFTDEAIEFLKMQQGEPFFLTVSFNSLHHLIHEVPEKYLRKHGCDPIPNYDPSMGKYEDYYRKYAVPDPVDEKWRRFYLANLECLDDNIGRILDALDELQLSKNTLVIFFSDNGGSPYTGANNKPLSGSKYNLREGGIRVPLMMRFPGRFNPGVTYPHIVSSLDIVPTCLAAAVIEIQEDRLDGLNLLNELSNMELNPVRSTPLFWRWKEQFAVRHGDWKLLKLADTKTCLYNLKSDVAEQHDLSARYPEKLRDLLDAYNSWWREMEESTNQHRKQ